MIQVRIRRWMAVVLAVWAVVFVGVALTARRWFAAPAKTYVGGPVCAQCHASIAASYAHTAHFRTSSLPGADTIHGTFANGKNGLQTGNPDLSFTMEETPAGWFETAWLKSSSGLARHTERIGVVVGSGRKGQTYLFWDGDRLFELPVSYYTESGAWANSPGYTDDEAKFDRPIFPRCLECHATSFRSLAPPENRFAPASLELGISCEKCHGPGSEHVSRYRSASPPRTAAESAIVNPARLSRERQIDVCALCHAGGDLVSPALSFVPGEDISQHLIFPPAPSEAALDVHANQIELLRRSRCFQSSATMTCATCHDTHAPQRDLTAFAARCLACHQVSSCGVFARDGARIATQCVVCHMPLQQTAKISTSIAGRDFAPKVRNHRIAIYEAPDSAGAPDGGR